MSVQARPQDYAQAIYDLAIEAWTRQLGDVQKALQADAALRARVRDAGQPVQTRLQDLDSTTSGGLSQGVRRVLGTLIESGQIDQLDAILIELGRLVHRQPERRLAQVTSAVPLTAQEQNAFRSRLAKRYGAELEFQFDVDPLLIGGVRLRVGDQVIDGSVAGKLAALRDHLAA